MRHQEERTFVAVERLLQLLDGRQVEVVGGLVEHQAVHALSHQHREERTAPLARGQPLARPEDVVGPERELGEQRPGLVDRVARARQEDVEHGARAREQAAALVHLADDDARPDVTTPLGQREATQQGLEQRGLAAAVGPEHGDAFLPADLEVDRPQPEAGVLRAPLAPLDHRAFQAGDDIAAARLWRQRHVQLPTLPRLLDRLELRQLLLGRADLRRLLLGAIDEEVALGLVGVARLLLGAPRAFLRPRPLRARPVDETRALRPVLLVRLVLLAARQLARRHVLAPTTCELRRPVRLLTDLHDAIDRAVEEGAVVGDDDHRADQSGHKALEPVEAGEVEVVGGLVEQEDAEAREQDGGQRGAGGLTARQRTHLDAQAVVGEAHVGTHRAGPRLEVVSTQGEEALERLGVRVDERRVVVHLRRQPVEVGAGRGHARPPGEVGDQRLARAGVGLLGQIAHRQRRGGALDPPLVGGFEAGQDAQQGRFADAVRAHDTDAAAGPHRQRDLVEDQLRAPVTRDAARREHAKP